jgi:hypothetical protein
MSSDLEVLAREAMQQFTAEMRVSPDLAARTCERHRRRQRRQVLHAGLTLAATGVVTAVAVIAAVAHGSATKATPIAAPVLGARLMAAIESVSGDILYAHAPGAPLGGGQYPAYPQPGQEVQVRVGPDVGSDGKVYKDGEYSFTMPAANPYANYTGHLDQGGLQLSGTVMVVNHFGHVWRECPSTFVLGFALDPAAIHAELANGQFTVIGPTELNGQQAIELQINVPPNNEAPPHIVAERMWVNATTYLPMREWQRMSDGQQSTVDYVFLPPTPANLAELRPAIPAGYTQAACA